MFYIPGEKKFVTKLYPLFFYVTNFSLEFGSCKLITIPPKKGHFYAAIARCRPLFWMTSEVTSFLALFLIVGIGTESPSAGHPCVNVTFCV